MFTLLRIYFDNELRIQAIKDDREPVAVVVYSFIDFIIAVILLLLFNF